MQHNGSFCNLCFCFVSDKPANECTSWKSTSLSVSARHCHASDTGRDAFMWKGRRYRAKAAQDTAPVSFFAANPPPSPPTVQTPTPVQVVVGVGPFEPDNELESNDLHLTNCRKCGWYNKYAHKNFTGIDQKIVITGEDLGLHPVGFLDWCHGCGRVASENDFGKVQARHIHESLVISSSARRLFPFVLLLTTLASLRNSRITGRPRRKDRVQQIGTTWKPNWKKTSSSIGWESIQPGR